MTERSFWITVVKQELDIPPKKVSVLQKLKGLYLSIEHIQKLAYMKSKYKISESRLVEKALEEFFNKYE